MIGSLSIFSNRVEKMFVVGLSSPKSSNGDQDAHYRDNHHHAIISLYSGQIEDLKSSEITCYSVITKIKGSLLKILVYPQFLFLFK
jgi:hypothetical protein